MTPDLIVVGAGGAASSVLEIAAQAGRQVRGVVEDHRDDSSRTQKLGHPVLGPLEALGDHSDAEVVLGVGDNGRRAAVASRIRASLPDLRFATLINPTAHVSRHARVEEGTVIGFGSYLGPDVVVGAHALVLSAMLGHDNELGPFASLAPGCTLAGGARVGARTMVGMHTAIRQSVSVGEDSLIGAASYVDRDLPSAVIAFGVPARVRRARNVTDPYY